MMPDTAVPSKNPVSVPLVNKPWGMLKSLKVARKNLLRILPEIATKQPMVSGKTGKRWHMVMDPTAIREILLDRLDDYPKSIITKNILRPAIGDSMFIAEGAHWRWQRRAAAPVFTHRNMMNLSPIMTAAAERAVQRITDAGGRGVDMMDEMVTTTFDIIADVTFSGGGTFDRDGVHNAIDDYISEAGKLSLFDIIGVPDWIPRPGRLRSSKALKEMKSLADKAIDDRAKRPSERVPDLLDLLLAGVDPKTKRSMNTAELRDNLLTFIVAGHETTALTLAWSLYLMAFDQDAQTRARQEAQSVLQGRTATGEDVANLPFIRQIIDEALRLYPPAGILSRTALKADTLCDREVLEGDTVMVPIYALHRNELLWDDPNSFKPERFEDRKAVPRYAYLPFGDGPRICIGASFALQEAVIILATLLSKFKFAPIKGRDPEPVMILTLRPEGGVWLTAEAV